MKMVRHQQNTNWPATVRSEIIIVAAKIPGEPSRYALRGIGEDAKALCPKNTYATQKNLIRAAKKCGWILEEEYASR